MYKLANMSLEENSNFSIHWLRLINESIYSSITYRPLRGNKTLETTHPLRCIQEPTLSAKSTLTLLELHSHFGDNPLKFHVVCLQIGTAVLKGLRGAIHDGSGGSGKILSRYFHRRRRSTVSLSPSSRKKPSKFVRGGVILSTRVIR